MPNPPEDQRADRARGRFPVQGPEGHGIPGLVNLYGIESPGITSSAAARREVVRLLA